ncbi:hypothetical protein LTR27_012371 [Elasticomyces elasticus]|nr:hypothetical protein LTR27_012371 [Elasticomyces elasticus]
MPHSEACGRECKGTKHRASKPSAYKIKQAKRAIKAKQDEITESEETGIAIAFELQQKCLNIFRDALQPSVDDTAVLQEVKGHLFNRDFDAAFGKEEYLRVYASRWSPARAVGFLQVLADVQHHVLGKQTDLDQLEIVCLGGGAGGEVVALAGWWATMLESLPETALQARFVDVAAWDRTVAALRKGCVTPPELSKYASSTAREVNHALLPEDRFSCTFLQQDVLSWQDPSMASTITPSTKMVTLFFVLNELYSASIPKTQRLLAQLTSAMPVGCFLLVVDSPGSYSTVSIKGTEKQYPMLWLLDHTLLESSRKADEEQIAAWEKVENDESRWFRLPTGLQYPIQLEDMRYQIHLYRRLGIASNG